MLRVLEHLGLDPVGFMRRALGAEDGLEIDRPPGEPPVIVVQVWDRVRSGAEGRGIDRSFLEALEEQRFQNPQKVWTLASWMVEHVELELVPQLLGIAGTALRLMLRLAEAEHVIHAGIEMAQGRDDRPTLGHLLQRLAYVVADRGDRAQALRLSERAATIHLRCGNRLAATKATADQGIWLYYLDRPDEAIETLKAVLDQLPPGPSRNRFMAFQCLGFSYQRLGDLDAALSSVDAAEKALPPSDEWARAKLLWLRAKVQADQGYLARAAAGLEDVVAVFRKLHHGEAALATCELARIHLARGHYQDASAVALGMRSLLEPLRHNKIVSAAIGDLLRSAHEGLTLALVERVTARIESERQKGRAWWSLRVSPPGNQPLGS